MNETTRDYSRPYWHVDAKWVCASFMVIALSFTVLVIGLLRITAPYPAIDTLSRSMVASYRPGLLETGSQVDRVRQEIESLLERAVSSLFGNVPSPPVEGVPPSQPGPSAEELRPIAAAYYHQGSSAARRVAGQQEATVPFAKLVPGDQGLWSFFTLRMHEILQRVGWAAGAASLLLTLAVISFSYRFGRLGSPGVVLVVVGLPGYLLLDLIARSLQRVASVPRPFLTPLAWLLNQLDNDILQIIAPSLGMIIEVYQLVTIVGLALVGLALIGSFVWRLTRRS